MLAIFCICVPRPVHADWKLKKFSSAKIGPMVIGSIDGRQSSVFATAYGNLYDGRVFKYTFSGGQWHQDKIFDTPFMGVAMRIGSPCGDASRLYIESNDEGLWALSPASGSWNGQLLRPGHAGGFAKIGEYQLPPSDIRRLQTNRGPIEVAIPADIDRVDFKCLSRGWGSQIISSQEYPVFYFVLAYGDARGEGRKSLYGTVYPEGQPFELRPGAKGWELSVFPVGKQNFRHMVIGDGRNDGYPNLYAAGDSALMEFHWEHGDWTSAYVERGGVHENVVIGAFRPDRIPRLYVGRGTGIAELTYDGSEWRTEHAFPELRGFVKGLQEGVVAGLTGDHLFFTDESAGGYYLEWQAGERVVVADFRNDGAAKKLSTIFSDILRTKLVEIGNCPVLERQEMDRILAEHRFQQTGASDREYAVHLGRLLGAKRVIVGSVGRLYGSTIATVNSVSVADGVIGRSLQGQWRSDDDLDATASALAQQICPSKDVLQ